MHYLFIDESYYSGKVFRVAGIIVPQERYTTSFNSVTLQSSKDRLRQIDDFLDDANGFGIICHVDLNAKYLTESTKVSYTDIKHLSRNDDLWSKVVVRTIQAAIIRLERVRGNVISMVDVYHDSKSLTPDHREVLYQHLKREGSDLFKSLYQKRGAKRLQKAHIRTITEVKKAKVGAADKFQRGVQLVDALLRLKNLQESRNIEVINITNHVHEIFTESGILKTQEHSTDS